mmetsp:Transcript_26307/g.36169  ORF Transcript_26307/g.36169 Transcript_26307/m.36169 type:complete len:262 (-) Transcript_26307:508-1293(-)
MYVVLRGLLGSSGSPKRNSTSSRPHTSSHARPAVGPRGSGERSRRPQKSVLVRLATPSSAWSSDSMAAQSGRPSSKRSLKWIAKKPALAAPAMSADSDTPTCTHRGEHTTGLGLGSAGATGLLGGMPQICRACWNMSGAGFSDRVCRDVSTKSKYCRRPNTVRMWSRRSSKLSITPSRGPPPRSRQSRSFCSVNSTSSLTAQPSPLLKIFSYSSSVSSGSSCGHSSDSISVRYSVVRYVFSITISHHCLLVISFLAPKQGY